MSLTQALNTALSGLQVKQASISMVAANVANADTPGYTRKVVNQVATGGNYKHRRPGQRHPARDRPLRAKPVAH